ncbi:MAG: PAS domain S-box protein [Leptolyngbyaceae cyanobacterium MAG.088]|nr:PAS domain S-box protein [Leptolyngbyaceae cyanobacterium MAG.088]
MDKTGATLNTLTLQPLDNSSLNHLIADTLHAPTHGVQPLTTLVMQKTQGNPFFVTQFLNVLHQDQLITFDADAGHWQCNMAQVQATVLTEDVVELIASQLQKLPSGTQSILKLAACIGAQFDLETLAIVSKQSTKQAAAALWKALQEGLVLPTSQGYKFFQSAETIHGENIANPTYCFLHDRVQQAAYSLIADHQKSETHWHIGNLLWQHWTDRLDDKIFDLVNQLNMGKSAIAPSTPKQSLAKLNLQAAQKAKLSAAHKAAQTYCQTGIDLLPTDTWQTDYELIYALHYHGAETAYLSGDFDQAEVLYEAALSQAKTPLEQAAIYRVQMTQYQFQGHNAEAIAIQRKSTQLLGWTLPIEPEQIQADLELEIAAVNQFLEQQTVTSILDLPKMADAKTEEILRILQILFYAAWLDGRPTLALLALAKMTALSLQSGNSEMSPFGYVGYGLIANIMLNNATQAHQFGSMAVQLCEQFDNADVRGMTNFLFAADVHSWKRPLQEADHYYENAYKYSMDAGNWLTVSFTMMLSGSDRLTYGKNLEDLYSITQAQVAFLRKIKSFENLDALTVGVLQPVRQLLGLTASSASFDDDNFSEADYLQTYQNTPYHLAWYYSVKIRHAYLFGQVESYLELIPKVDIIESTIPTHAKHPSTVFYGVLMHLTLIDQSIGDETHHWQAIQPLEDKLEQWRQDCPENIAHKCLLIQAEKARLTGQTATAIDCYEQSISQAQAQGYNYEAALANELAANFYLDWGKEKVAAGYMQEAYYGYSRWGAIAKVTDLKERYPELLRPILQSSMSSGDVLPSLNTTATTFGSVNSKNSFNNTSRDRTLDFASILKASQALSSTIHLNELLHQLTQIILQNSGGDRCALLLPTEQGEWQMRAFATAEEAQLCTVPLTNNSDLPIKLIQYVKNTQETIVIDDLKTDLPVIDNYLTRQKTRSVLCLPLLNQGSLIGIVYLKNQLTSGVFTHDCIQILNFLCTQAAISLENAFLFEARQRAEGDLQRKNSFLKAIQESSLNGMLVVDVNHRVSFYNQRFVSIWDIPDSILATKDDEQLLGYVLDQLENPTEFLSKVDYLYDHPEESSFDEIALRGERFLERYSSPIILPSGECDGRIWYFRDISDRKAAEQKLFESQTFLKTVLDTFPLAVFWKDRDCRYIGANQNFIQDAGFEKTEEIAGLTDFDMPWSATEAEAFRADDQEVMASDIPKLDIIQTQINADGTQAWLETNKLPLHDLDGNVIGVLSTYQDISDRKHNEQQLHTLSNKLELAIESAQIGIWEWDHHDNILSWDERMFAIYGVSPEKFRGTYQDWANCIHPEDLVKTEAQAPDDVISNGKSYTQEFRIIRPDGTIRYVLATASIQRNNQGQPIRSVGTNLDITERKEAEMALQDTQDQFRRMTENVPGMIYRWVLHADGGQKFIYVSSKVREFFELEPDAALKDETLIWQRIHPNDITQLKNDIAINTKVLKSFQSEFRLVLPQRGLRWVQINSQPEQLENGDVIWDGVLIDISDRKVAETSLTESEAYHRNLFEQSSIGLLLCRMNGEFVYANQAFANILGRGKDELPALTYWEITPKKYAEAEQQQLESLKQRQSYGPYEKEYIHKNGHLIPVRLSGVIVERHGENFIWSSIEDISDRKAAEKSLKSTQFAVDKAALGIFYIREDGSFLEVNESACSSLGYSYAELKRRYIWDIDPEVQLHEWNSYWKALKQNLFLRLEVHHQRKDGSIFPVEIIANYLEYDGEGFSFAQVQDISDRKAAEQEILLKQNHLEALLNNIPHMAWIKDEESRFIAANQAVAEVTGCSTVDIVGKTDYDIWPEELAHAVRNDDLAVLRSEQRKVVEEQVPKSDGTLSWLETTKTPFRNADNKLAGTVGIAMDITDRKQAAAAILQKSQDLEKALAELQNAQLQLVNSEKMSALGGLVSGVAHEINNPVGCIIGNVDVAQDYFSDLLALLDRYRARFPQPGADIEHELEAMDLDYIREDLPNLIRAMEDAGNRIKSISQSLRTFSRADKTTKQPFDLRAGLESTLLILRHRLKANEHRPAIVLETDYGDIPEINCFPGQLNQGFMNILANAIDMFDEMAEQITFQELEKSPQKIMIKIANLAEQVEIRISDNGTGMTDEVKARIFDHLFTTKAVGKGTGLGLAIAHQIIVDTHGGSLDVQSEVGQGTEFCIRLPL